MIAMKKDMRQIISGYFKDQPVEKAWLFGSYSRGEATRKSDVDILVRYIPFSEARFDYFQMIVDLEKLLKKKVDLVTENGLAKFAVDSVEQDKILIYERGTEG
jgi:predicted nucleotidyltransferase